MVRSLGFEFSFDFATGARYGDSPGRRQFTHIRPQPEVTEQLDSVTIGHWHNTLGVQVASGPAQSTRYIRWKAGVCYVACSTLMTTLPLLWPAAT